MDFGFDGARKLPRDVSRWKQTLSLRSTVCRRPFLDARAHLARTGRLPDPRISAPQSVPRG